MKGNYKYMNYKLTESQQSALEKIRKWFEDPNRKHQPEKRHR